MIALTILPLIAAIVFLVILGAGAYPWTVAVVAAVLSVLHLVCTASTREPPARRHRALEAVYAATLVFLLIQLLPLPTPLTRLHGPVRFQQNLMVAKAIDAATDIEAVPAQNTLFALTRSRSGTMRIMLLVIACFPSAFLVSNASERGKRAFLHFLCLLGGVLAVAGCVALRYKPQGDTLWWLYPIPHGLPGPVVCFANRNHFAGYLAVLCPTAVGLMFTDISTRRPLRALLCLISFCAMTVAIALSLSRGAVVAYAGAHLVLLMMYLVRRRWLPAAMLVAAGVAVIAALVLYGGRDFKVRMQSLLQPLSGSFEERLDAWETCVTIWRSYPLTGAGPNAFRNVFPQHRVSSRRSIMTHAENEYMEILADTGVAGCVLSILCIAAFVSYTRSRPAGATQLPGDQKLTRARADMATAVWSGLSAAALHASFEFAMHLPLYALTTAAMAGLLLSRQDDGLLWPLKRKAIFRRIDWPSALGLASVIILSSQVRPMRDMDAPEYLRKADARQVARALTWAPSSWHAWYQLGRVTWGNTPDHTRLSEKCITRAAELDPNNYLLWRDLGNLRRDLGMTDEARAAYARVKQLRSWVSVPDL